MALHKQMISAKRSSEYGSPPSFIRLGHKHLEKERPAMADKPEASIPVDLLRIGGAPQELVDQIDEVVLGYKRKP